MKLVALHCNHCGAPIEVPSRVRFLTCEFCEAKLEVKHEGNAHFTEVLESLQKELAELKVRDRLRTIDDGWERQRKRLLVSGKHGHTSVPTHGGAIAIGAMAGVVGLFMMTVAGSFGIIPIVLGVGFAAILYAKASTYKKAYASYRRRRQEAMRRLRKGAESP